MGARGLRAIIEDIMLEIMYEIPSMGNVTKCIIVITSYSIHYTKLYDAQNSFPRFLTDSGLNILSFKSGDV